MHRFTFPVLVSFVALAAPAGAQTAQARARAHTASTKPTPSAWRTAYSDETMTVSLDPAKTARLADGTYRTRLRWAYASDQPIGRGRAYRTMIETRLVDCTHVRSKPVSAETFDARQKLVSSYANSDGDLALIGWSTRKPDTPNGKAYEGICKTITSK